MGYKVLDNSNEWREKYQPRKGLEGPFLFAGGRVLYYDAKVGSYWDPRTDFYLERDEVSYLHNELVRILEKS